MSDLLTFANYGDYLTTMLGTYVDICYFRSMFNEYQGDELEVRINNSIVGMGQNWVPIHKLNWLSLTKYIEHSMFLIDHFEGYVSPLLTLRCTIFVDLWELGEPAAPWGVWGYESSVATDIMVRCKRSGNDLTDLSPLVNTDGLTNFWGAKGTNKKRRFQ